MPRLRDYLILRLPPAHRDLSRPRQLAVWALAGVPVAAISLVLRLLVQPENLSTLYAALYSVVVVTLSFAALSYNLRVAVRFLARTPRR